jgi:ELWxxDGT repeat protein
VVVGDYVFLFQQTGFDDPDTIRLWEYHIPTDTVRQVDLSAFRLLGDTGVAFFGDLAFAAEIVDGSGSTETVLAKLTPGGVPSVVKLVPGRADDLAAGADAPYFSVGDETLWSSGLTEATTVEVADGLSRIDDLKPTPRGDGTEIVYFEADDATAGIEPHRYDPDTGVIVFDVENGAADSRPSEFYTIGNAAYFRARASGVSSPYRLAGADATTITPELLQAEASAMVGSGRRVFITFETGSGTELAYFDHDAAGGSGAFVTVDADFVPLRSGLALGPSGALLAVSPDAGQSAIWYTDGVTATEVRETAPLELPFSGFAGGADATGASALFVADDGTGERVWRYNPAPTLSSIDPAVFGDDFSSRDVAFFASAVADHWVFPAVDDVVGLEPFGSNGTTARTSVIADLAPGTNGSAPTFLGENAPGGVDVRVSRASTAARHELLSVDPEAIPGVLDLGLDEDDELEAFFREPDGSFLMVVDRGGADERLVRSVGGVATDLGFPG